MSATCRYLPIAIFLSCIISFEGYSNQPTRKGYRRYSAIADSAYYAGNYHEAINNYELAVQSENLESNPSIVNLANGYANLGFTYSVIGDHHRSASLVEQSLLLFYQLNDSVEIAIQKANLAISLFHLGKYNRALDYMERALQFEKILGNIEGQSINLNSIGKIYEKWGKYDEAIDFYKQALLIDQKASNYGRVAIRLSSIGSVFRQSGDLDSALFYQQRALDIDRSIGYKLGVAIRLERIGDVFQHKGSYKIAEGYFYEALNIFDSLGIKNSYASLLLSIGRNYRKLGSKIEAIQSLEKCISIGSELNLEPLMLNANEELSKLYAELNDYKLAHHYLLKTVELKDKLFSDENLRSINEFNAKYELEKRVSQNIILEKDLRLKIVQQRWFLILFVLITLLFIVSLLIFRVKIRFQKNKRLLLKREQELIEANLLSKRAENQALEERVFAEKQINRLQKEKHTNEIQLKSLKLASTTVCLVNKNEVLEEVLKMLISRNPNESIDHILHFIKVNLDIDQNWHHFKLEFEKTSPGFFDKLTLNYPNLSEQDVRMCAYLAIGLTTKEISRLLNISIDAVNKSRQRLRKKMNFAAETDLHQMLKTI